MTYPLTCVSCFFEIKNKHGNKFYSWFENTLKINSPYIIFGDKKSLNKIKKYREGFLTHYVEIEISDFYTFKYYNNIQTHTNHCPSKELNLIWNEKLFFMEKAKNLNIFNSDYFAWVDAGICNYRNSKPPNEPFPNINKLTLLSSNKFNFTSSESPYYNYHEGYYHYISGTYVLHKSFISEFIKYYKETCDKYLSLNDWIYTDQVLLTKIYNENKSLFRHVGHGYGEIINLLY